MQSMIPDYEWSAEQLAAIEADGHDVIVSASAGSGKTTLMIERILRLLAKGASIDRMLIVTFAVAQADDMSAKLAHYLSVCAKNASDPALAEKLRKQSFLLGTASISTLHSYCADLIRRYAYAAGVDPDFAVSAEMDSEIRKTAAVERAIRDALEASRESGDTVFPELYDALLGHRRHTDLAAAVRKASALADTLEDPSRLRALTRDAVATAEADLAAMRALAVRKWRARYTAIFEKYPALSRKQSDYVSARIGWCDGGGIGKSPSLSGARKSDDDPDAKEELKAVADRIRTELALFDRLEAQFASGEPLVQAQYIEAFSALCDRYRTLYAEAKRADGVLDFSDLEHVAHDLLANNPDVAASERERFDYLFVDEFQDINPLQKSILDLLSRAVGAFPPRDNLFLVGDVKQSIYAFRLCDSAIFRREYEALSARGAGYAIDLNCNYRSRGGILAFCDFLFGKLCTETFGGVDYAAKARFNAVCDDADGREPRVEVLLVEKRAKDRTKAEALPVYSVRDDRAATDDDLGSRREGELIAARIRAYRRSAEAVGDAVAAIDGKIEKLDRKIDALRARADEEARAETKRFVAERAALVARQDALRRDGLPYSDFAVLLRSTESARSRQLIDALRKAGIPISLRRDRDLLGSPSVCALVDLLRLLVSPRRDYPLVGVMTSKLFGFSARDLALVRLASRDTPFLWDAVVGYAERGGDPDLKARLAAFAERLERYRAAASYETPRDILLRAVNETGYLDAVREGADGAAEADLVRVFLHELAASVRNTSIVDWLAFVDAGGEWKVDLVEGGTDAVTVSTIHKSKGLEYPVVFAAGLGVKFNFRETRDPVIVHKRYGVVFRTYDIGRREYRKSALREIANKQIPQELREEELRLLYVAATRAERKLFLVGETDVSALGKIAPISPYDAASTDRMIDWVLGALAHDANGPVGDGTGRERAECAYVVRTAADAIARSEEPAEAAEPVCAAEPGFAADAVESVRAAWETPYPYPTDRLKKTTASHVLEEIGAESGRTVAHGIAEYAPLADGAEDATARGSAYHAVLEACDFGASDPDGETERLEREGLVPAEIAALVDPKKIGAAIRAVRGLGVTDPARLRRELRFVGAVSAASIERLGGTQRARADDDTILLQGAIDLLIDTGDGRVIVVDYKTGGKNEAQMRQTYGPQLAVYAEVCENAGYTVVEKRIWAIDRGQWIVL